MSKTIIVNEVEYEIKRESNGMVFCNGMRFISENYLIKYLESKGK